MVFSYFSKFNVCFNAKPDFVFNPPLSGPSGLEVLVAFRDYIKYFFGCRECAQHFWNMAKFLESDIKQSDDPNSSLVWLWKAHNR